MVRYWYKIKAENYQLFASYIAKSPVFIKKVKTGLFLVSLLIVESTDNTSKRNYMLISFVLFQRSVASRHIEDCVKQVSEKKWRSRFNKKESTAFDNTERNSFLSG